ncbi:MAG: FliI/YscN family ATPase [Armatimonadetes bacterium]|nr:FliI/YscN family ATPase [Armatimonadota bacterium]
MMELQFDRLHDALDRHSMIEHSGRVTDVTGIIVEANGPNAHIGDLCVIESGEGQKLMAEVVGFRETHVILSPLGEMQSIRAGCKVRATASVLKAPFGPGVLGRVLDGLGNPVDGLGPLHNIDFAPVFNTPPNPIERRVIDSPLPTGVRAIDGLLTLGEGQRVGIFAGSGVGKSTLLGMIARNASADVNVIALVGERGREVREFLKYDLGEEGLKRSVVVCATSEQPAVVRVKAAMLATAIAEGFRDEGKKVLLMMDSVTRFAMAQREIGLAVGEPPSTKGYTPSVFALLPKLMERAGMGKEGSITALYTVLVEGDDTNEPIADATRSILDGHIVLSRRLTSRGHYPPIDVRESLSRTMPLVVPQAQVTTANAFRELLSAYSDIEDLVSIGAYKPGSKPVADRALERKEVMDRFLRQDKAEASSFDVTCAQLNEAVA